MIIAMKWHEHMRNNQGRHSKTVVNKSRNVYLMEVSPLLLASGEKMEEGVLLLVLQYWKNGG